MRFVMIVIPKDYLGAAPKTTPDPKAIAAMMKYNDSLQKAGVLLALDGLRPPSEGVRVSFANGKAIAANGPFADAKEAFGGYWVIQVTSKDEAVEWAKRCPMTNGDIIEIRQIQEIEDFPADVQKEVAAFPEVSEKFSAGKIRK